ncbi:NAD(P)H azoreductase [Burkholderiales bacterium]|nr:NAD(P)H azoreductase [Burkholderiales bacterium]
MKTRPLIAVLGATGAQGGGLVRAILADPARTFDVRAITRRPDSPAARALATLGAEVAHGDLDAVASLDRAFDGAHGVYVVTNFWEHCSPERELAQAGNAARAAERARARHVVWASLEDTRRRVPLSDPRMPTLMGRYKVPHYDAKGEADALFAGVPTTFLRASFYWDNLIHFGLGPKRGADGALEFALPMGDRKLPGIAAADIGPCALGVFKRGEELAGQAFGIAGGHVSGADMAAGLSRALGEPVRYVALPFRDYVDLGYPGGHDMANMFRYKHDFNDEYRAAQSVERTRELHPGLLDFGQWLAIHARSIARLEAAAA